MAKGRGHTKNRAFRCEHTEDEHYGRGLCDSCYSKLALLYSRAEFDRRYPRVVDPRYLRLVHAWEDLSAIGYSKKQVAEKMSVTVDALNASLRRHRRRLAELKEQEEADG